MYNNNDIAEKLSDFFSKLDKEDKSLFIAEMIKKHKVFNMSDDFLVRFYDHVQTHVIMPKYIQKEEIDKFLKSD